MTGPLATIASAAPAIAMLGCFACIAGGAVLIVRQRNYFKGTLMLVMAAVLMGNVLIWTM